MSNPYAASGTSMDDNVQATYDPPLFSFSGRIGRVRYISFGVILQIAAFLIGGALIGIVAALFRGENSAALIGAVSLLLYLPMFVITIVLARRRLNDLDQSGWLSLLMLVPLVNVLFGLFLLVAPGTRGSNRYGPEPCANSSLIIVVACIFPFGIIGIIGILAAIALPAYQTYTQKAKFTEVVLATNAAKIAVEICAQDNAQQNPGSTRIRGCGADNNGVPANMTTPQGRIASLTIEDNGVITATAVNGDGLQGQTYILVPTFSGDRVVWTVEGTCRSRSPRIC